MMTFLNAFNPRHAGLAIGIMMLCAPVGATVLISADLKELVADAQVIVHGRVIALQAEWMDGRRRIDTFVTLEVDRYLKGNFGPNVTFRVPGGDMGRYRSLMVGAPTFTIGDEVVLFLDANGPSVPHVVGLSQGVYRVMFDGGSGQKVVVPSPLVGSDAAPQRIVRGDLSRRSIALDAFGEQVRSLLASAVGHRP